MAWKDVLQIFLSAAGLLVPLSVWQHIDLDLAWRMVVAPIIIAGAYAVLHGAVFAVWDRREARRNRREQQRQLDEQREREEKRRLAEHLENAVSTVIHGLEFRSWGHEQMVMDVAYMLEEFERHTDIRIMNLNRERMQALLPVFKFMLRYLEDRDLDQALKIAGKLTEEADDKGS